MTGIYFYLYAAAVRPVLVLERHAIPVEIVNESGKRYQVKYMARHMDGSAPGTLHWVQKRKVRLDEPLNLEYTYLPYKN